MTIKAIDLDSGVRNKRAERYTELTPRNIRGYSKANAKGFINKHFPELASHKVLIEAISYQFEAMWHTGYSCGEENAECSNCSRHW